MGGFDQFLWDQDLWDHLATGGFAGQAGVFLGVVNAVPAFLGLMDAAHSLGEINAAAQHLGSMQAALRLGKVPVRKGA